MEDEPEFRCRRCGLRVANDPGDAYCAWCENEEQIIRLENCDTQPAPAIGGRE